VTDVTENREQAGAELSAADEQVLRELTERARTGGLKLTGEGGLLGRLTKVVVEGARQAMIRSAMMTILYPEAEVFSAPVRHDEPRFVRRDDGLGTVAQPELAQHATDVGLHGLFRDHEAVRNLDV
jgi:hypothetical protein